MLVESAGIDRHGVSTSTGRGQGDEESPLLPSSSSSPSYSPSAASQQHYYDASYFNDLTYSDDEETDEFWDGVYGELGGAGGTSGATTCGSISDSLDTATLLADVRDAQVAIVGFPVQQPNNESMQQQQQQQSSHLMPPLARHESVQSSVGDEEIHSLTGLLGIPAIVLAFHQPPATHAKRP